MLMELMLRIHKARGSMEASLWFQIFVCIYRLQYEMYLYKMSQILKAALCAL